MEPTDAIELTRELVRTPGLSGDESRVADVVENAMRQLGYREVHRDDLGSVVGVVGREGARPQLLFDGHMDVVAPAGRWTVDPWGAEISDGRLYGRGSVDMKGGLAAALMGVAAAAAGGSLSAPVAVSASVLEETVEGVALGRVLDVLDPAAVVICEPSDLAVKLGQRGRLELVLTIVGTPAHAASPEAGDNPLLRIGGAINAVEATPRTAHTAFEPPIIVPTDITSNPYPSISLIPPEVRIRWDRRTVPDDTSAGVLAQLREALGALSADRFEVEVAGDPIRAYTGVEVTALREFPAWLIDQSHPLATALVTAVESQGRQPRIGTWGFCTNGSESAGKRGLPTVGLGPGRPDRAHTEDESVAVDDVAMAAAIYRDLCIDYGGVGNGVA